MNETIKSVLDASLIEVKGISKKTGKSYRMLKLRIDTAEYGEVDILLDTDKTKAGIVLDMIARKE